MIKFKSFEDAEFYAMHIRGVVNIKSVVLDGSGELAKSVELESEYFDMIEDCFGKRVLLTIENGKVLCSTIHKKSPNGKYVYVGGTYPRDDGVYGWFDIRTIQILDVLE